MKKLFILLSMLLSQVAFSQQIVNVNVNEIRGMDTTQGGCSDYDSIYVRTSGVIYGNNFGLSSNRIQFSLVEKRADTLLNNRCGIGLFKSTTSIPVTLNEGDSVTVVGLVNCFNGLSQINIDSIKVHKIGCSLTQPRVINLLDEVSESFLVKMINMEFLSSNWPASASGSGFTAKAFRGTPGATDYLEFDVRIDNDCNLFGAPMPQGKVDIVGIGGQFDSSIPRDSRYQLLPRSSADITPAAPVELPSISFQDTVHTIMEGTVYVIPIKSTTAPTSQISCLVVSEDITTINLDYTLQQPSIATFPTSSLTTNFGFTINSDNESEPDEQFYLRLRKLSNNYNIGADSVAKITIVGTTSNKNLQYFDIFKNSYNGSLNVKLPSGFTGQVVVYNSIGQPILTSKDSEINQDLSNLKNIPPGIYRAIFQTGSKRFTRTFLN